MHSEDLDQLTSPEYRALLRHEHETTSWGKAGASHADTVREWAARVGATSVLDYGCGGATLKKPLTQTSGLFVFDVQEYDPGIPGKTQMPRPADLVVCTDVLEHVEPDKLDAVLKHLRVLALRGAFFVIAPGPDKKHTLADGRNAHLIIKPPDWWLGRLRWAGFRIERIGTRKGLWVWVK